MSDDEIKRLKAEIESLQIELRHKQVEVANYKNQLLKFSANLDEALSDVQQETKALQQIQKYLIPTELPQFPGFEFSRKFVYGSKIGGDYFDVFEHEDKLKFGIIISSSSGYAMSALFLSLILKLSHILEAKKGMAPRKVIEHIGEELKKLASDKDQTQALYAVMDRRDLSFTFCAVGRISGFLLNPDGLLHRLSSKSSGLGPALSPDYEEVKLMLEPKSKLVLMTEGLSDVLSQEHIAKIINSSKAKSVHDLRNELLFEAQLQSGLETPVRDQTVIVLEVKDKIIKLAKA